MQIDRNAPVLQLCQEVDQILQRPGQTASIPGGDEVDLAPGNCLTKGTIAGTLISPLSAPYAFVLKNLHDIPAQAFPRLSERLKLVRDRL